MFENIQTKPQENSDKPLVSVIIPVYNGIPYLKETINSVLESTYKNLEIVLVDDGSKDTSKAICRGYSQKYPNISFYSFEDNRGMDHALNMGIRKSNGKYIARINQDDIMVKDRLEKQVNFLETNPDHVIVGGQIQLFTNENPNYDTVNFPLTDEELKSKWLMVSPYSDPTVMYRREAVLRTYGYSQKFWPADDVHMWYQLGSLGKLANLPDVLTLVRWHKGAGSIKLHRLQMQKTWEVHKWAEKNVGKPSMAVKLFWIGEHIAGYLFSPQFNWFVYRNLKRLVFLKNTTIKNISQLPKLGFSSLKTF